MATFWGGRRICVYAYILLTMRHVRMHLRSPIGQGTVRRDASQTSTWHRHCPQSPPSPASSCFPPSRLTNDRRNRLRFFLATETFKFKSFYYYLSLIIIFHGSVAFYGIDTNLSINVMVRYLFSLLTCLYLDRSCGLF